MSNEIQNNAIKFQKPKYTKLIGIILIILIGLFTIISLSISEETKLSIYPYSVNNIDGSKVELSSFKGKVLLIVNVASFCGNTPQYEGLQKLFSKYKNQGFEVLGFPCNQFGKQEPGTADEIKEFCSTKYNVTFRLFEKIDVNGPSAHPLYNFLTHQTGTPEPLPIKWNFAKFLIGKDGTIYKRYGHKIQPEELEADIISLLKQ
ncbi:MAG: glutathione peroxidase [Ignavibacteria bacterium]|nr:glutathione peroxidase [Ignavibacteria bacterium]